MAYELKCPAPGPSRVTVFVCVCFSRARHSFDSVSTHPEGFISSGKLRGLLKCKGVNLAMDKHPIQRQIGGRSDGTSHIPIHCSLLKLG